MWLVATGLVVLSKQQFCLQCFTFLFFSGVSLARLEVTPWVTRSNVLLNSSNNSVSKGLRALHKPHLINSTDFPMGQVRSTDNYV